MTDSLLVPTDFDYTSYDSEVADQLREAAQRIRARGRDQISAIIDIGKALASVKTKVEHGKWGAWLASEFSMSVSTADRYIRAAEFADKFVTVTNLSPSMLYLVSAKSTPPSLAQEVVERAAANEPLPREEVQCRLNQIKEQKGAARKPLAASNINRESDRVATPQDPPGDRHEAAALAADPLEQIKRLMANAGDPVDIIRALILELDDAATQRFNIWFFARVETHGTPSDDVGDLAAGDVPDSIGSLQDSGTGDADPGISTTDRAHALGDVSAAPVGADVGVSSPGIETGEYPDNDSTGLGPAVLGGVPADPAAREGSGAAPHEPREKQQQSPALKPINDPLENAYQAMSVEERDRDRHWVMRGHVRGEAPTERSPFLAQYLTATPAEQKAFRSRLVAEPTPKAA